MSKSSEAVAEALGALREKIGGEPMRKTDLRRFVVIRQGVTMGHGVLFPRINRVAYNPASIPGSRGIYDYGASDFIARMTRIGAVVTWQE